MERSDEGRRTLAQLIARRQADILIVACVAGGLTLTSMVMGSSELMGVEALPAVAPTVATVATELPTEIDIASASSVAAEVDVDTIETAVPAGDPPITAPEQPGAPALATQQGAGFVDVVPVAVVPASSAPERGSPTEEPSATPPPAVAPARTVPPPTTAAPTTAAPTTPAPTVTAAPTTAPAVVAALTYSTHQSGSSGVVTLQSDGSAMYITSVVAQADWVFEVEKNGPRTVEIKFFNVVTKKEGEFHATLEGGRIKVEN